MANAVFPKGMEWLGGAGDWFNNKIKAILVDMDDAGPAAGAFKVTAVSNADPSTITTQAAHGLTTGDWVAIFGVGGATGVNGIWQVASAPTGTTFTVDLPAAPGAYTSGGYIADLSLQFLSQFVPTGGRVATSSALTSKTMVDGVFDAADISWPGVAGDATEAILIVHAADTEGAGDLADTAQRLISIHASVTGLPLAANPGTVNWTIPTTGLFSINPK